MPSDLAHPIFDSIHGSFVESDVHSRNRLDFGGPTTPGLWFCGALNDTLYRLDRNHPGTIISQHLTPGGNLCSPWSIGGDGDTGWLIERQRESSPPMRVYRFDSEWHSGGSWPVVEQSIDGDSYVIWTVSYYPMIRNILTKYDAQNFSTIHSWQITGLRQLYAVGGGCDVLWTYGQELEGMWSIQRRSLFNPRQVIYRHTIPPGIQGEYISDIGGGAEKLWLAYSYDNTILSLRLPECDAIDGVWPAPTVGPAGIGGK